MRGLIAALGAVVFIAVVPAAQADVQPYGARTTPAASTTCCRRAPTAWPTASSSPPS